MGKTDSFYNNLKDWPWKVFLRLYPAYMVLIILIGLGAWAVDPAGLWTLGIVGVIAALLSQKLLIGVAAIVICVIIWAIIQVVEMAIIMAVSTYVVAGITGTLAICFDRNPMTTVFKKKKIV